MDAGLRGLARAAPLVHLARVWGLQRTVRAARVLSGHHHASVVLKGVPGETLGKRVGASSCRLGLSSC